MPRPRIALAFDADLTAEMALSMAAEAEALRGIGNVEVVPIMAPVRRDKKKRPQLKPHVVEPFSDRGFTPTIAPYTVSADLVIWHDPTCIARHYSLRTRYAARQVLVVLHDDAALTNQVPLLDIDAVAELVDQAFFAGGKSLIQAHETHPAALKAAFDALADDWHWRKEIWPRAHVRDHLPPPRKPSDRRGAIFGTEHCHYPRRETLERLFPKHADYCGLICHPSMLAGEPADHWELVSRSVTLSRFLRDADFVLCYSNPYWQGALDQDIANAVAAGKFVLTDPVRAKGFGPGVIGVAPDGVDDVINRLINEPGAYRAAVEGSQATMTDWASSGFAEAISTIVQATIGDA